MDLHLHLYRREKPLRPADKWQLGLDLSGRETASQRGLGTRGHHAICQTTVLSSRQLLPGRNASPVLPDLLVFQNKPELRILKRELSQAVNVGWGKKNFFLNIMETKPTFDLV